tara:strand:- start:1559 stop:3403 length:1845 start_codon:yes stop_codon:yes gene_type:complete
MSDKKVRAIAIKYTSREFDTIKRDLTDYVRRYYPDTYRDFNEASFGSLMIDTVAYVGDMLSFYLDYQANETFLHTSVEYNNIIKLGRQLGWKFKTAPSSYGIATFYVLIPATASGLGPDKRYMPVLRRGSTFKASTGSGFILNEDVHFGNPNNEVRVARQNETTGTPTAFAVKAFGEVVSGRYYIERHTIGSFKKFRRLELNALDIAEVMKITDEEGNEYYETDFLSQNVIYRGVTNRDKTCGSTTYSYSVGDQASEILKPFMVPRRFTTERNRRKTVVQFGASSDVSLPKDMIAEPASVIMKVHGKNYISDESFDPTRLIESDKFGIGPSNTVLSVTYRMNTSQNVNCRVGQLNKVATARLEFEDLSILDTNSVKAVRGSLEVDNEDPIVGYVRLPDATELKHRIYDNYATQNRAVTQQDYESYVYRMPEKFGGIKRCKILRDHDSLKRNLNLYILCENRGGTLTQANQVVKKNLKMWLIKNKMINDTIDIMDAKIVNIGIDFTAIASVEYPKHDVLKAARERLIQFYQRYPDIGEPFFITDVYKELKKVDGLVDVTDVRITQKLGNSATRSYSDIRIDLDGSTSADGRYIEMPLNVIYEVKYPANDISGVII